MDNYYDRNTTSKKSKAKEKHKSFMTKVVVVQLVLSLLVSGALFLICKTESNFSKDIKSFYDEICEKDIAVSSVIDVFKNVVKQTFAPIKQDEEMTNEAFGETKKESGEKANFSPVFLTVKLDNPLKKGDVTSIFGYRISPITNKKSLHKGLDIATNENTKIYASYDGIVEKAEHHYINGNYIVLKHSESLKTTYNHCNKLLVKAGDEVKKGECIALVGATGYATGNHLHFEIIVNDMYINPMWVLEYDI